jgi:hypothetical protein
MVCMAEIIVCLDGFCGWNVALSLRNCETLVGAKQRSSKIHHGRLTSHETMARLDLVEFEVHFMSVAVE